MHLARHILAGKTERRIHHAPPVVALCSPYFDSQRTVSSGRHGDIAVDTLVKLDICQFRGNVAVTAVFTKRLLSKFHYFGQLFLSYSFSLSKILRSVKNAAFQQFVANCQFQALILLAVGIRKNVQPQNLPPEPVEIPAVTHK